MDYYKKARVRYKKEPKEYWDSVAKKYKSLDAVLVPGDLPSKNQYYDSVQRKVLTRILEKLPKRLKILEIGCGVGRWCRLLAKAGLDVTGVDISDEMIEVAKSFARQEKLKNIKFMAQSA